MASQFEAPHNPADGRAACRAGTCSCCTRVLPPPPAPDLVTALIGERRGTHGDWAVQAGIAGAIKAALRRGPSWPAMMPAQQEALDMMAVKMSRAVSGDPTHADHWDDMAGYARLGKQGQAGIDQVQDWAGHT
jgi:hypothetical protein